jgi:hypothetical protein
MADRLIPLMQRVTDYTSAQETVLASTLTGVPYGGAIIYNTDLGKVRNWNGTAFITVDIDDFLDGAKTAKIGTGSNMDGVSGIKAGTSAPSNTNFLWIDTN